MTPEKLLCKIARVLENLKIPYFVTGGFAVAVLAKPRFTADIDIVIKLAPQKISQLSKKLLALDKDIYLSEEAIKDALKNKGEFNFIHSQTGLKVDFWIKRYLFEKFERGIVKKINGQKVVFISPEDLILSKLIWYKESESSRHLEDVESILEIARPDLNYIKKWAKKGSTYKILTEIIKK